MKFQIIKSSPKTITLHCNPEIIDDLIFILDKLLSLSHHLKNQSRYIQAHIKAHNSQLLAAQEKIFNDKSHHLYQKYLSYRTKQLTPSATIQKLKKDFNMGYYDVEIYVTQGRKLEKIERNNQIRLKHKEGLSIKQLSTAYQLSYHTIRSIINCNTPQ